MTIKAEIIKDSITIDGNRLTTWVLEYPRIIHSELLTHKMLSKNSASSRAIPFKKMQQNILDNTAKPVYWGKNQPGMTAKEELDAESIEKAIQIWNNARDSALYYANLLVDLNVHKQIANRVAEFASNIKIIMTGTEHDNFFFLRDHADAQPEFANLARKMRIAYDSSTPCSVGHGEWHLPFIDTCEDDLGIIGYFVNKQQVSLEDAKKISASCCAQISYRNHDDSLEKALQIYDKLITSVPSHLSPVEHQATPINKNTNPWNPLTWEDGITHVRRDGSLWSANFQGWIQLRQTLPKLQSWM